MVSSLKRSTRFPKVVAPGAGVHCSAGPVFHRSLPRIRYRFYDRPRLRWCCRCCYLCRDHRHL
jgi:hypothetical protein